MKRFLCALLLSALLAGSANAQGGMMPGPGTVHTTTAPSTWTIIATAGCQYTSASSGCTTSAIDTTAGGGANLIIAAQSFNAGVTGNAITDSASNFWAAGHNNGGGGSGFAISIQNYLISPTTSATHTFTIAGTNGFGGLTVLAVRDTAGTPSENAFSLSTCGTGTSMPNGSLTPPSNHALFVSSIMYDSTPAAPLTSISPGTIDAQLSNNATAHGVGVAHYEQAVAAAANLTWTMPTGITGACSLVIEFLP